MKAHKGPAGGTKGIGGFEKSATREKSDPKQFDFPVRVCVGFVPLLQKSAQNLGYGNKVMKRT